MAASESGSVREGKSNVQESPSASTDIHYSQSKSVDLSVGSESFEAYLGVRGVFHPVLNSTAANRANQCLWLGNQIFLAETIPQTPAVTQMKPEQKEMSLERENELLSLTNPSRMAPRVFLKIPSAVDAVCREMSGLLRKDRHGVPALMRIELADKTYLNVRRIFSTMVVQKNLRPCIRPGYVPGGI